VVGLREVQFDITDLSDTAITNNFPIKKVSAVTIGLEGIGHSPNIGSSYHSEVPNVREVFVRVVNNWQLSAVVGVMVRDHYRVDVFETDMVLHIGEGARTAVNPESGRGGLNQISTACLSCRCIASRTTKHGKRKSCHNT
jgi:hypothetical protein